MPSSTTASMRGGYMEGGDHATPIRMEGEQFARLTRRPGAATSARTIEPLDPPAAPARSSDFKQNSRACSRPIRREPFSALRSQQAAASVMGRNALDVAGHQLA